METVINNSLKRRLDYVKEVYDKCQTDGKFSITAIRNKYGVDRAFQRVFVQQQKYILNKGNAAYPEYVWNKRDKSGDDIIPNIQMVIAINEAAKRGKKPTVRPTTSIAQMREKGDKLQDAIKTLKEYREKYASKIKAIDEVMSVFE